MTIKPISTLPHFVDIMNTPDNTSPIRRFGAHTFVGIALALILSVGVPKAWAHLLINTTPSGNSAGQVDTNGNVGLGPFGVIFQVKTAISATAIGAFDNGGDGAFDYTNGFRVNLYENYSGAASLIASVAVDDGSDQVVENGGSWLMEGITPVTLYPGTNYCVRVSEDTYGGGLFSGWGFGNDSYSDTAGSSPGGNSAATYHWAMDFVAARFYDDASQDPFNYGLPTSPTNRIRGVTLDFDLLPNPSIQTNLLVTTVTGGDSVGQDDSGGFYAPGPYAVFFDVKKTASVKSLGVFDNGGDLKFDWTNGYRVSLYKQVGTAGVLIASNIVTSATSTLLVENGGSWLLGPAAPIVLHPGITYALRVTAAGFDSAGLYSAHGTDRDGYSDTWGTSPAGNSAAAYHTNINVTATKFYTENVIDPFTFGASAGTNNRIRGVTLNANFHETETHPPALMVTTAAGGNSAGQTGTWHHGPYALLFSVKTNLTVQSLGIFDNGGDGWLTYTNGYVATLYENVGGTGNVIASATVNNSSRPVAEEAMWLFENITPVVLHPGTNYALRVSGAGIPELGLISVGKYQDAHSDTLGTEPTNNSAAVFNENFEISVARFYDADTQDPFNYGLPTTTTDQIRGVNLGFYHHSIQSLTNRWEPETTAGSFTVLEVIGEPGTVVSSSLYAPSGATNLWLHVNGLGYENKAGVRINGGSWITLNNTNCVFDFPGKPLEGMGGPLDTLSFRVSGISLTGGQTNTVSFRFEESDGFSSGFRVLELNALTSAGAFGNARLEPVLPTWTGGTNTSDINAGSNLWYTATLKPYWTATNYINAKCFDCHADTGLDLKYFGFSEHSIVQRAIFHGLSTNEGTQLAAYIRSLPSESHGTPWNPPFQPGPGLSERPVDEWAAGAGLKWVLPDDHKTWAYLLNDAPLSVSFTNTVNTKNLPVSVPFPDWNEWLPQVHYKDSYGTNFQVVINAYNAARNETDISQIPLRFGEIRAKMSDFINDDNNSALLPDGTETLSRWYNASQRWLTVKAWEIVRSGELEDKGTNMYSFPVQSRTWPAADLVFTSAPHFTYKDPRTNYFRNRGTLGWGYRSHQWYWLQLALNDSNHRRGGSSPIDWGYLPAFTSGQGAAGLPFSAQMITAIIKAGEATTYNPTNFDNGFTGFKNVRTEYLIPREGPNMWTGYSPSFRDSVIQTWLTEYKRMIYLVGRDHFRDVTREITGSETNNSPGAPQAEPWINSHAAMTRWFRGNGCSQGILDDMLEIAEYMWPGADWSGFYAP